MHLQNETNRVGKLGTTSIQAAKDISELGVGWKKAFRYVFSLCSLAVYGGR